MRPSRHLIVVSVGVLVAFSGTPSRAAESVSNLAQPAKTDEPQPTLPQEAKLPLDTAPSMAAMRALEAQPAVPNPTIAAVRSKQARYRLAQKPATKKPGGAQVAPATTATDLAPAPSISPLPEPTTPDPGPSKPLGPAKPGAAPEYLNPDPNPLSFPTKPSEVKLRGIQPISLQQAIELAQRNNRSLQVNRLQLERSRASLRQAQAASYPTLGIQSSLGRSQSANNRNQSQSNNALSSLLGINNTNNNENTISNTFSASATLSYDIFTSGQRPANIRAAEQQLRSDEIQVEVNQEQLRLDVASDYYNLQQGDESVRINQAAVRNNEFSLRDTQALERAGLGTRFDVLQAQVQLSNSRQNLTNAIAQQQIYRRQLAQRLSLSPAIDLAAADSVDVAGSWNLSLEESIVLALKNRGELEQQLAQRELARQQRRAALAGLGPTVTAQTQYQLSDVLNDSSPIGSGYAFSLGLNWNLYDGGLSVARAQQAEANIAIAEQNFADLSNQIRFAVEQAYANLLSNFENIGTTTQGLEQARESLRLARLRFQAGVGTQTDVINAENALTQAEGNRVNAILGYNRALASLQRAITNLPIATGATTPSTTGFGTTAPNTSNPSAPATLPSPTSPNPTPPKLTSPSPSAPGTQTP